MRNIYDLVALQPLIRAARALPYAPSAAALYAQFPDRTVFDINYRIGRANQLAQSVPVRAFDMPAPNIARPGAIDITGGLPAISAALPLTESDMFRARRLAGLIAPEELKASIAGDVALTTDAVKNTVLRLQGLALSTGQIAFNENGVVQTVDFNVPSGQKLTASTLWSASNSVDVLTDLQTYYDAFVAAYGGPPTQLLGSLRIIRALQKNTVVIAAAAGSLLGRTRVSLTELNDVLNEIGLPSITPVEARLKDVAGTVTRLFPDNVLTFLPDAGQIGETQWGLTAEAEALQGAGVLTSAEELPGAVVVTMMEDDPVARYVKTASVALPIIDTIEGIVIASVMS